MAYYRVDFIFTFTLKVFKWRMVVRSEIFIRFERVVNDHVQHFVMRSVSFAIETLSLSTGDLRKRQ